jgi:oligopeptide transport system substrate-binding protein
VSTVYENNIVLDLFEGLTTVDAAGRPIPGVAESWSLSDDGLTWTFTLRPDLKWSDGEPLTADDVVYSFQRLMDPATASQYPYLLYALQNAETINAGEAAPSTLGVEATEPLEVVLRFSTPVTYLLELLSNGFAVVVPRHAIARYGEKWAAPSVMVSNGAFVLDGWRPQDRVDLVRNANYREAESNTLSRVIYMPTEDQSAAVARFRSGELDTNLEFPTARTAWLQENLPNETRIAPYLITFYLSFNTSRLPLSDVRVRRALSLAIDRHTLAERVLRSGEQAASTFVPPYVSNYQPPDLEVSSLSMEERLHKSRALLSEAGFGPSNPLRLTYSLSSAEDRMRVAAAVIAMWRELGVRVSLYNTESKILFSRLRSGDFEIGYAGWAADVNDADNFLSILHSRATNSNYARFNNGEYDDLLDQASSTIDSRLRLSLLSKAESLLMLETPIAPLFHGVSKNLVGRHVEGWVDNSRDAHLSRYLTLVVEPGAEN